MDTGSEADEADARFSGGRSPRGERGGVVRDVERDTGGETDAVLTLEERRTTGADLRGERGGSEAREAVGFLHKRRKMRDAASPKASTAVYRADRLRGPLFGLRGSSGQLFIEPRPGLLPAHFSVFRWQVAAPRPSSGVRFEQKRGKKAPKSASSRGETVAVLLKMRLTTMKLLALPRPLPRMTRRFFALESKKEEEKSPGPQVEAQTVTEKKKKKPTLMQAVKELGVPFLIYWTSVWAASGVGLYLILETTGFDAIAALSRMGYDLEIDPKYAKYGNVAIAAAVNEMAEIVRFPFCVATFKPVYTRYKAARAKQ